MGYKIIKGIDEKLWNKLKGLSILNKRTIGQEINVMIDNHFYVDIKNHIREIEDVKTDTLSQP